MRLMPSSLPNESSSSGLMDFSTTFSFSCFLSIKLTLLIVDVVVVFAIVNLFLKCFFFSKFSSRAIFYSININKFML